MEEFYKGDFASDNAERLNHFQIIKMMMYFQEKRECEGQWLVC